MGRDKSELRLGGASFVKRIEGALSAIAARKSLVGARDEQTNLSLPRVQDIHEKWGALGGLHAALSACRAPWAAVVACDLPFVGADFFLRLSELRDGFDAIVPVQTDGRIQPLAALYRKEPCLSRAEELIQSGERRPRALLDRVKTRRVALAEYCDLYGADLFLTNVNTPEDYAQAREKNER